MIDQTKGYWQVPVHETHDSFNTLLGKYQFKVVSLGLVGVPPVFQRLMNTLLSHFGNFAMTYTDDAVIFGRS